MRENVTTRLGGEYDTYEIGRQLHDVPPHEVYEVTVGGRRAVYKGDTGPTGNAGVEGRVMAFVGERTSIPVPEPLLIGDDYYVAAWHADAPAPHGEQTAEETWAAAAGRGLATLHDETAPAIETYGQFRPLGDDVTVVGSDDWHSAALEYVRRRRPMLAEHGHADVADAVVDFLANHPDAFAGVDGPVCCHGWATPEHVSVADEQVACLVDFEHAIAAPGGFDYWRTAMVAFDRTEADPCQEAFRDGYESVRPLPDGAERRRPLYALLHYVYYFESLYVQSQHGPEETAERAGRLREGLCELLDTVRDGPREDG